MARERRKDTNPRAVVKLRWVSRQIGGSQSDWTRGTYRDRTMVQRRLLAARYHCCDCGLHSLALEFQGPPLWKSWREDVDMPLVLESRSCRKEAIASPVTHIGCAFQLS